MPKNSLAWMLSLNALINIKKLKILSIDSLSRQIDFIDFWKILFYNFVSLIQLYSFMVRGIIFVILACVIWGLIYVIPSFLPAFNPLEIAFGRYVFYGFVSCIFMLGFRQKSLKSIPLNLWKKAFLIGFLANIGFYPAAILSMRFAHPAIAALIMGMSPITIALYGNWKEKECSFKNLLWPCLAIGIGLILVNMPALEHSIQEESTPLYCLGLFFGFVSLAVWSLYAVWNGRLLKKHPELSSSDWCSIVGIATATWVAGLSLIFFLFAPENHHHKFIFYTPELGAFLIGTLVLGTVCSWLGFFLWNKGCSLIPVSLAGQLTIFETLFGIFFVFLFESQAPTPIECLGIAIMLGGIYISIKMFIDTSESATIALESQQ